MIWMFTIAALVAMAAFSVSGVVAADAPSDPTVTNRPAGIPNAISAMKSASDAAQVRQVFEAADKASPRNLQLHQAFIRRMVDLTRPELAYGPARTLVGMQADQGLAWAVIADMSARYDRTHKAM